RLKLCEYHLRSLMCAHLQCHGGLDRECLGNRSRALSLTGDDSKLAERVACSARGQRDSGTIDMLLGSVSAVMTQDVRGCFIISQRDVKQDTDGRQTLSVRRCVSLRTAEYDE